MGGTGYMAAIAVGSMIFNVTYWLFSFLRFGTGGMTAQSFGAKDEAECSNMLLRSQLTCFLIAVTLIVAQVPIFKTAMLAIKPDAAIVEYIRTYFFICIYGTVPSLSLYAFTGWFVGMQNTKLPMVISITQNIINIALSYVLVFIFGMKIEGVALGTVLAQWGGMAMAVIVVMMKYGGMLRQKVSRPLTTVFRFREMKRFFSVNRMIFFRTLFLVAVNMYFIVAGAKSGSVVLAANSILMQMFILYTYVMDGFAFAAEALCGRYYGAGDRHNFSLALRGVWICGIILTVAYTLFYAFGGGLLFRMLTDDSVIRDAATSYLPWAVAIPFCGIAAFVWDGVFVGITNTKGMLAGTFFGAFVFFTLFKVFFPYIENNALWLAFDGYLFTRGFVQHIIYILNKPFK